ncbi:MAG: sinR 1 [Flavipsychrobacter sp.]|nr:sinR 1 [Flavipsychrobacter sp.]
MRVVPSWKIVAATSKAFERFGNYFTLGNFCSEKRMFIFFVIFFSVQLGGTGTGNAVLNLIFSSLMLCWSENKTNKGGKYERNENSPSVEMAVKIARAFDVPVDYLLGEGKHAAYDKDTIRRMEEITALDPATRNILFNLIDTYIRDAKVRNAHK